MLEWCVASAVDAEQVTSIGTDDGAVVGSSLDGDAVRAVQRITLHSRPVQTCQGEGFGSGGVLGGEDTAGAGGEGFDLVAPFAIAAVDHDVVAWGDGGLRHGVVSAWTDKGCMHGGSR